MTTPSGQIRLGGQDANYSVAYETRLVLGGVTGATQSTSMGSDIIRRFAGKMSGQIAMSDLKNKPAFSTTGGSVNEGGCVGISAPSGYSITRVTWGWYGWPANYPTQQTCAYDYDQYGNPSCRCGGRSYTPGLQSVGTSWSFCANNGMGVGDPCGGVYKRGTVFVECVTGYFPPVTQNIYYTYTYDQYGNVTSSTYHNDRTWRTQGWY